MLGMLDCALEAPELWGQIQLRMHPASEAQPFRATVAVLLSAPAARMRCPGQNKKIRCGGAVAM